MNCWSTTFHSISSTRFFALLLAADVWLMIAGPAIDTPESVRVQATGQEIIVYASIVCLFIQAHGAARLSTDTGAEG